MSPMIVNVSLTDINVMEYLNSTLIAVKNLP